MSNNIAIYNFKGGVGKTTTTLNIGYHWAKSFKVLLIDADPQCNLTTVLSPKKTTSKTLHDYTKRILHNQEPSPEPIVIHPYLHLIPGNYEMVKMESNPHFMHFGTEIIWKLFARLGRQYDIIIIDCPTNFGSYVKAIIQNSNSVLIPTIPDIFSVSGVQTLLRHINSLNSVKPVNILGIFFNMYRTDRIQNRKIFESSQTIFENILLNSSISMSIKLREATARGMPISNYIPDHNISAEFNSLCEELLTKLYEYKTLDHDDITRKMKELNLSESEYHSQL